MWLCGCTPQLGKSITLLCKEKTTVWISECTQLTFKDEIPLLRAELWGSRKRPAQQPEVGDLLTPVPNTSAFFLLDYGPRPHESKPGLTASKKIEPQSYSCKEPTCANQPEYVWKETPPPPNQAVANTMISASWDHEHQALLCCP